MKPSRKKNSIAGKIIALLLGVAFSMLILEMGLRGGVFLFTFLQKHNNRASFAQKGAYRILCMGESTTAGQYPRFLEEILNRNKAVLKFSVIDNGIFAATTLSILLKLESSLDKYKPDMVVVMMGCNDRHIMYYCDIPEADTRLFDCCRVYRFARIIYMEISGKMNGTVKLKPWNSQQCYGLLARLYRTAGDFSKAETLLVKSLELDPRDIWSVDGLVQLYWKQDKLPEAERVLKKFLEVDPKNDWAYRALETVYQRMNKTELTSEYKKKIAAFDLGGCNRMTANNYHKLKSILDKRGTRLVCVQYPMCSIEPLKKIFEGERGVIFVDNEEVFKRAVKESEYSDYFIDVFGGNFGHCTPKGNRLLAENIAKVILKEVSGKYEFLR